jgi:hypothetical protein
MKLPKLFRWTPGRQGTGYRIFPLMRWIYPIPIRFDSYILHYPKGSSIGWHSDPNPFGNHYRLNFELWRGKGGDFLCGETIVDWGRLHIFRPDINPHRVTEVTEGTRIVFSLGWIWGKDNAQAVPV